MKKHQETINLREKKSRPDLNFFSEGLVLGSGLRVVLVVFAVILICFVGFWIFFNKAGNGDAGWYAVKLVDEEIYYGRLTDLAADPIVMSDVYYNYNQDEKEASEAGNIRLVKRGNETHGPDGTMNIPRSQVVYMEPLGEDSKVLRAILEDEGEGKK